MKCTSLNSLPISTLLQIPHTQHLSPKLNLLPLQPTLTLFYPNQPQNLNPKQFQLYYHPIPFILPQPSLTTPFYHHNPVIKLPSLILQRLSSSSIYQIPST
ncbi:spore germination protein GerPE, partial [Bacillus pumilus]|uniref:spore germination protein GerPE n=1 Tax=Bacillus pumilus TaxID=1408 RepID=UPI003703EB03